MKWIDLPPVWLIGALMLVWIWAPFDPLSFGPVWAVPFGTFLLIAGVSLILVAAWEMYRHKTTVIPHREANNLVSEGIFGFSRNPIYLGDALVLVGVILRADAVLALVLVPVFLIIITRRFIEPEESRLQANFGADFETYCDKTKRWL